MRKQARIVAMASYLPERILTNADLEKMVETSDEWILSRVGISERRIARPDEGSSDMGAEAAKKLFFEQNISPDSIDLILVATMTPDYLAPSTAALIQSKVRAMNAAAVDFQAACTGFIYGLSLAKAYIESGMYERILLVASEKMSSFVDYQDRNTCILFGDGAACALIEGTGKGFLIESISLGADGSSPEIAWILQEALFIRPHRKLLEKKSTFFRCKAKNFLSMQSEKWLSRLKNVWPQLTLKKRTSAGLFLIKQILGLSTLFLKRLQLILLVCTARFINMEILQLQALRLL